jgi:hypothetical protein
MEYQKIDTNHQKPMKIVQCQNCMTVTWARPGDPLFVRLEKQFAALAGRRLAERAKP